MCYSRLKKDFILGRIARKFSPVIDYELKFVKMQFLVKSISLWQQLTKNFHIDQIRISRDLDLLLKIRRQELNVWCLANNLREKEKIVYVWIQIKREHISNLMFSIAVIIIKLIWVNVFRVDSFRMTRIRISDPRSFGSWSIKKTRWILSQSGFVHSFAALWSAWS